MKLFSPVPFLVCAMVITGAAISGLSKASAAETGALISMAPPQEAAQDNTAAPNIPSVAGNWMMSWEARNRTQRKVTMQIKQDGSKLSGTFESERGSAPLKGSLQGNQVSFSVKLPKRQGSFTGKVDGDKMSGTTEQGTSWTATRQ